MIFNPAIHSIVARSTLARCVCIVVLTKSFALAESFVRIESTQQQSCLQTRTTTYLHPSGARVTLIATVHHAEADYFNDIRVRLTKADGVAFEGISRHRTKLRIGFDSQAKMNLLSQANAIPCRGDQFVRGDLDEETFERVRDCSIPIALVPDTRQKLAESIMQAQTDPGIRHATEAALAIPQRNAQAIITLKQRLNRGNQKIVLLYGASHAADLQKRLVDELGFAIESTEWAIAFRY